jgi:hypothetical protein
MKTVQTGMGLEFVYPSIVFLFLFSFFTKEWIIFTVFGGALIPFMICDLFVRMQNFDRSTGQSQKRSDKCGARVDKEGNLVEDRSQTRLFTTDWGKFKRERWCPEIKSIDWRYEIVTEMNGIGDVRFSIVKIHERRGIFGKVFCDVLYFNCRSHGINKIYEWRKDESSCWTTTNHSEAMQRINEDALSYAKQDYRETYREEIVVDVMEDVR